MKYYNKCRYDQSLISEKGQDNSSLLYRHQGLNVMTKQVPVVRRDIENLNSRRKLPHVIITLSWNLEFYYVKFSMFGTQIVEPNNLL